MRFPPTILALAGILPLAIAQLSADPSLVNTATAAPYPAAPDPNNYASPGGGPVYGGKVRRYYIQINEYLWNYMPSGRDLFHGKPIAKSPAATWFGKTPSTIGATNIKALYRGYTDGTFKKPLPHESWLGTLGPIIRAEVGDQIRVVLSNLGNFNYSIHPHGVLYTISNEGALYEGSALGSIVNPGGKYEYVWEVPPRSGPGPNDGQSVLWGYHSHVQDAEDIFSGLTGAIIIYRKGTLGPNGLPKVYDREYLLQLLVYDENQSHYLQRNVKAANITAAALNTPEFTESNMKHSINGYAFNNLPNITMRMGDRVRFYFMGFGNEEDIHNIGIHGNVLTYDRHHVDTMELLPAIFRSADMIPDNPGQWMMQCETTDHSIGGMIASYQVLPAKKKTTKKPVIKPTKKSTKKPSTSKPKATPTAHY